MGWQFLRTRREDLPEMRWPLVMTAVLAVCFFGGTAAVLRGRAALLILPFLALAVSACTLLILLWRRAASMAVFPLTVLAALGFGGRPLMSLVCAACILAVSYVYAVLFLARATRFVRITAMAFGLGVCSLLSGLAWLSLRYGTVTDAILHYRDPFRAAAAESVQALQRFSVSGGTGGGAVLLPEAMDPLLYQLVLAIPALLGWVSMGIAAFCDGCIRLLFRVLDCGAYFTPEEDRGITMPRSFAVLYGIFLFLVMSTSSVSNPHLYRILANCHFVFALPCAYVGLSAGVSRIRDRWAEASFYHHAPSHSPVPAVLVSVFMILFFGFPTAFTLTATAGAALVVLKR